MLNQSDIDYLRLSKVTPCGSQTLSKMPIRFVQGVYPKVLSHGSGGHVWDTDGNSYIDLIAGLGAVSVGYSDKYINKAVCEQLGKGVSFSLPILLEAEVSELLCSLIPHTEMWKYGKNGTDATVMAVRAARAFTGRDKIMTVGYNGCADVFEVNGSRTAGIPKVLSDLNHKAIYNDIESFQSLRDGTYACLIMEPMVYEYPKAGFLEALRELCTETGTLLIFDEVVTGGRFKGFTAQSYFNVVPDLTCLGKAIANGFPLCAVGGPRPIMSTFERNDFFASGTFGGEAISLKACLETVSKLHSNLSDTLVKGQRIKDAFNEVFQGLAMCEGYPTRLIFKFPTSDHKALFMQEMCYSNVLIGHANMIMVNHTDYDVVVIVNAFCLAQKILTGNWTNPLAAMRGEVPQDALTVRK